jgi:hypothetical protein
MVDNPFLVVASAMRVWTVCTCVWEPNILSRAAHIAADVECVVTLIRTSRVSEEKNVTKQHLITSHLASVHRIGYLGDCLTRFFLEKLS